MMLVQRFVSKSNFWVIAVSLSIATVDTRLNAGPVTNLTAEQKQANADAGSYQHLQQNILRRQNVARPNRQRGTIGQEEFNRLQERLKKLLAVIDKLENSGDRRDLEKQLKSKRIKRQMAGRRLAEAEESFGDAKENYDDNYNGPHTDEARRNSLANRLESARDELNAAQAEFDIANNEYAEASTNYQAGEQSLTDLQTAADRLADRIAGAVNDSSASAGGTTLYNLLLGGPSVPPENARSPGMSFYAPMSLPNGTSAIAGMAGYGSGYFGHSNNQSYLPYSSNWSVWGSVSSGGGKSGPAAARQKYGARSAQVGVDYSLTQKTKIGVSFSQQTSSSETPGQATTIDTETQGVGIGVATELPFDIEANVLAAFERSSNEAVMTNIFGAYNHDTSYLAILARKTLNLHDGLWLAPKAGATWAQARREGYTNSFGVYVPGSEIDHSQVSAGFEFGKDWLFDSLNNGEFSVFAGAETVFVTDKPDDFVLGGGAVAKASSRNVNLSAGMDLSFDDQMTFSLEGTSSQGQHDESRWSVTGNASLKLSAIFGDTGGDGTLGFQAQSDGKNDLGKVLLNLPF